MTPKGAVYRIPVETYSRVVGYFRPVDQWNKGKAEEFRKRHNQNGEEIKRRLKEDE